MRNLIIMLVSVLILMTGCTPDQSEEVAKLKEEIANLKIIAGPPPASLDNLFPPITPAPILLIKMHEMSSSFGGIAIDMFENDLENSRVHYERFKAQYIDNAKLVPEWENDYPMKPVEELGKALESGEQEKIMAAYETVGKVCYDCHIDNMLKVQYKYHWKDFSSISLTHPVSGEDMDFKQLMWFIESPFTGIMLEIMEGKVENAIQHFETVTEGFKLMKESCFACHDTEKEYYVGQTVQDMLDMMGANLKSDSLDPKLIGELIQGIGMESCFKCHLVHLPSAINKTRWQVWEMAGGE